MARLALALEAFTDIWDLVDGYQIESSIADSMIWALGADVLIFRNMETQGAYFGMARLVRIGASAQGRDRTVVFDNIRIFTVELAYPAGVTMLTRLHYLDDAEFVSIVRQGMPEAVTRVASETPAEDRPQTLLVGSPTPTIGKVSDTIAALRQAANETCALTGERAGANGIVAIVWPKGGESALRPNNVLFLTPEADEAFRRGHFAATSNFGIIINMSLIDRALLARINLTGKLLLPADAGFEPSHDNLAFHLLYVFGAGR